MFTFWKQRPYENEHISKVDKSVAERLVSCNGPYMNKFGYVWILLCEGLTPAQLANYLRRIENDPQTEMIENRVEEFQVTCADCVCAY